MNCIATSLKASVGPWNNSNNFISPTFEIFTTSFSLNVEYDFLIKDESSSFEIKSTENWLIISEDNSAPINSDVIKTSAGGAFKVKIARVKNLKDAIYHLKTEDISIIGLSEKGKNKIYDCKLNIPLGIVLGSEDRGISRGIINLCDETVNIPIENIDSLNVSVAFSVIAYEAKRQRIF